MSNFLTGLAQLNPQVKRHNGGTTTLTLDQNGTTNATMLYVNGVAQTPGIDFNVSGATLTTTSTLPAGTNICTTIQYFNTGIVNTVADNAIGLGQMASGVDGNVISYDASGNPVAVATGSDGQVLTSTGAGSPPAFEAIPPAAGVTLGTAVATTSGTTFDFTGIPSGTKRVSISLAGCSFNAAVWALVQIGDSGGIETSSYETLSSYVSASVVGTKFTNGWNWAKFGDASYIFSGTITLTLVDPATYTWSGGGVTYFGGGTTPNIIVGYKALSAELDRIRVTTNSGSSAWDAGKLNITYE
jgi:hypothetical protein